MYQIITNNIPEFEALVRSRPGEWVDAEFIVVAERQIYLTTKNQEVIDSLKSHYKLLQEGYPMAMEFGSSNIRWRLLRKTSLIRRILLYVRGK